MTKLLGAVVFGQDRRSLPEAETHHKLKEDVTKMSMESLKFWLPKFVFEVRRVDQQHYPPDSLLYWLAAKPEI